MPLRQEIAGFYARLAGSGPDEAPSPSALGLAALLEATPLPLFALDAQGRITAWNEAAQRVLARGTGDAMGRRLAGLPEAAGAPWEEMHRRVMAGERVQDVELGW